MNPSPEHIVFFDGVCGLCNKSIDLLVRLDKKRVLRYAPLQGETASRLLPPEDTSSLQSIVYYSRGKRYDRSDAVLRLLTDLGGGWKILHAFTLIPAFLRNALYSGIARHRYRWFGKKESCRIPTKEERSLFLD